MALLQIAEPGRAAAPHQHRLAVGIDLGTTNSLVATVRSAPAHGAGRRRRAACCCLQWCTTEADGLLAWWAMWRGRIGRAATRATPMASAKRLIGRSLADVAATPVCRSTLAPLISDTRRRHTSRVPGPEVSPVEVGAEVLRSLREGPCRGQRWAGALVGAVITVPAYFDDAQRQATKDAAAQRRAERASVAERTHGRGRRLRAGPAPTKASVPSSSTTSVAAPSTSRACCALTRGVFEVIATSRRPGAGRRRLRPPHSPTWFAGATGGDWGRRRHWAALHAAARARKGSAERLPMSVHDDLPATARRPRRQRLAWTGARLRRR